MEKEKLILELRNSFDQTKKELGFKSSFDEIDDIFYLQNCILKDGFVSQKFSRQVCRNISELFISWNNYLHNLIFPNPNYILGMMESKMLDENEKKDVSNLMSEAMGLISTSMLINLNKDKKMEAKFIDDAVEFWRKRYNPELVKIMKKISDKWNKK